MPPPAVERATSKQDLAVVPDAKYITADTPKDF